MDGKGFPTVGLVEAFDVFHLSNRARRLTPATLHYYQKTLGLFIRWCEARQITQVDQVSPALIRRYLAESSDAGKSTHTTHKYARALRTFCNFLVAEEMLTRSPMNGVPMPRTQNMLPTSFTEAEAEAILKACVTGRDKVICMVLLDTGVRASELCALNVGDVDARRGVIVVKRGKGQKERVAFVGARTSKEVAKYLLERSEAAPTAPLFLARRNERLTYSGLGHIMNRLRRRTGIAHLSAHTFRRSFALWSLRSGMSIYHLQRLMGHADLTVLQRYLGLVDADLRAAHEQHGLIDHMRR
jgi:integrase/recombinase XerD